MKNHLADMKKVSELDAKIVQGRKVSPRWGCTFKFSDSKQDG